MRQYNRTAGGYQVELDERSKPDAWRYRATHGRFTGWGATPEAAITDCRAFARRQLAGSRSDRAWRLAVAAE